MTAATVFLIADLAGYTALTEAHGGEEAAVCQMRLRPHTAPARLPFGDVAYHFCSLECARAFAASPDSYVRAR